MTETGNPLKLWMPATYRIQVQGTVDERYANRLGGLTILPVDAGDGGLSQHCAAPCSIRQPCSAY